METRAGPVFNESLPGEQTTVVIPNLSKQEEYHNFCVTHKSFPLFSGKHIPYNVTIKASTSAGYGPLVSDITFTEEGSKFNHQSLA